MLSWKVRQAPLSLQLTRSLRWSFRRRGNIWTGSSHPRQAQHGRDDLPNQF